MINKKDVKQHNYRNWNSNTDKMACSNKGGSKVLLWKTWISMVLSQVHLLLTYRQIFNIRRTFIGQTKFAHSDVVGASPVGADLATSSFST